MILIVESGGTKADVALIDSQQNVEYTTMNGFNPTVSHGNDLKASISSTPRIANNLFEIKKVAFYGAGMAKPANIELVKQLLVEIFPLSEIELAEDMVGAIRASQSLNDGDRIVCILGTGCNLALIKNNEVIKSGVSLGFILGDEGSGAYLGKKFLTQVLRDQYEPTVWNDVSQHFENKSKEDIVTTLYKHPKPNQWLGSLCPLIKKHISDSQINQLVDASFQAFVDAKLNTYATSKELPIYFIGSIALHFEKEIKQVLSRNGYRFESIIEKPIEKLVEFEIYRMDQ